jgi:RNA polymerase sigma-54 factor
MRLSFGQNQVQKQIQTLAPRMIQSMEILQLPIAALQERIERELVENPVLEAREGDADQPESENDDPIGDTSAVENKELVVDSAHNNADDFERLINLDQDVPDHFDGPKPSSNRIQEEGDRQHDALANLAPQDESLQDYLMLQLGELEINDPEVAKMCERIISFLTPADGGYLRTPLEDLLPPTADEAQKLKAQEALKIVQDLDPPGIAARDLRECLLIQIDDDLPFAEEMRVLVDKHLEDLRDNRLPQISKATGYSFETIREALADIRKLNPRPAAGFRHDHAQAVTPDVWVEQNEDGSYRVRLDDSQTRELYISRYYRKRLQSGEATPEERDFIRKKVIAAQWLIESIEQRRNTLRKVAQAIVDHQRSFLEFGPEFIEPLKMQQIAEKVGVHVTTISRAVDEKWIETPRGLYPLKRFFAAGTTTDSGEDVAWDKIRIRLQEVVDEEDKSKPYSDDELVNILKSKGLNVARRTITKYRQKMGIPSSRQRRQWESK